MTITCPVCGSQIGRWDLCGHYRKRICLDCCKVTNHGDDTPRPSKDESA